MQQSIALMPRFQLAINVMFKHQVNRWIKVFLLFSSTVLSFNSSNAQMGLGLSRKPALKVQNLSEEKHTVILMDASENTIVFNSTLQGWYTTDRANEVDQYHYSFIPNYIVGNNGYRNFFTFDLSGLDLTGKHIVSAKLYIMDNGCNISLLDPLTYTLHDVSTTKEQLEKDYWGDDPAGHTIWEDLGSGKNYGNYVQALAVTKTYRTFELNANALADITAKAGSEFSIGGTIKEDFYNSFLFGCSENNLQQQLVLQLADGDGTDTRSIVTSSLTLNSLCAGSNLNVPYTATGTYNTSNTFIGQLSDANGSFATPVNIGSVSSQTSGSITATIPETTPPGTGYRIRVISNDPEVIGADNGSDITVKALPAITCPANIMVNAEEGKCGAHVSFAATGLGNITYSHAPGSLFPIGTTSVTATSTNDCDTISCTFTVTVNDTKASVTGGGNLLLKTSADQKKSGTDTKMTFSLNVRYNKTGTSPQGDFNATVHHTDDYGKMHLYHIKATSITSLTVDASTTVDHPHPTAIFKGNVSIQGNINAPKPTVADDNATMEVSITDVDEGGKWDKMAITIWDKNNNLLLATNGTGTSSGEQLLSGGNLKISAGTYAGCTGTTNSITASERYMVVEDVNTSITNDLQLKVSPNPAVNTFTVQVLSNNQKPIIMRVTDIQGRLLEMRTNITNGQRLQLGRSYKTGIYIIEAIQGIKRTQARAVKLPQ
jgi:hypothetical protein